MKSLKIILICVVFILLASVGFTEVVEKTIKVDKENPFLIQLDNEYGVINFDHLKHIENVKCMECHVKFIEVKLNKEVGHNYCKACHKQKALNIKCSTCHNK